MFQGTFRQKSPQSEFSAGAIRTNQFKSLIAKTLRVFESSAWHGERALMIPGTASQTQFPRVIVVGNEKGGSGKSTVAIHIAVALMKLGQSVGTIDLDSRQSSFTHYIANRRAWAERIGRDLGIPNHVCLDDELIPADSDPPTGVKKLADTIAKFANDCNYIVI